jgi:hypothetical protein
VKSAEELAHIRKAARRTKAAMQTAVAMAAEGVNENHKPHPTEIRDAEIISNAVRFDILLFLGVGRFATATAPTLEAAREEAQRLAESNP